MIELDGLTKHYDGRPAVDDLTLTIRPGVVTGFLGPNGAGKSTTMRMLVGLEAPDNGTCTVNGRPYATHAAPAREVGVLLDAAGRHPGRSARDHLLAQAATHRIPASRVDEVLDVVILADVARRRSGGFSLGMGQRLGIASALLGDPRTVMLDEPVNGLDPDGIRWIRGLLRTMADEGRTVLVSSHLMSEVALTADHLVVIGRGRLVTDMSVDDVVAQSPTSVRVRSPEAARLRALLVADDVTVTTGADGAMDVTGLSPKVIGERAATAGLALHELTLRRASLEEAYMALTADAVEFQGAGTTTSTTTPASELERTAA